MSARSSLTLCLSLGSVIGCGGEDPPPAPPTEVELVVLDRASGAPVEGAWVRVGADGPWTETQAGASTWTLEAGAHPVRVVAPGFLPSPGPFEVAAEVTAVAMQTITATLSLEPSRQPAPGILRGTVTEDGAPKADALVVASGSVEAGGLTDPRGSFVLVNLPVGSYAVRGLARSRTSSPVTASADVAGSANAEVVLEVGGGVPVSGAVSGDAAATATLQLLHAASGWPVPGLEVSITGGAPYTVEGVPPGRYRLEAGRAPDDGWVMDPEPLRMGPLEVDVEGAPIQGIDVGLAPSIAGLTPTGGASVEAAPELSWGAVPEVDFYVLELVDAAGRTLWGGFDATGNWRFRVLAAETSWRYDGAPLTPGARYRWRVMAARQDPIVPSGFVLFAGSELEAGGFVVQP